MTNSYCFPNPLNCHEVAFGRAVDSMDREEIISTVLPFDYLTIVINSGRYGINKIIHMLLVFPMTQQQKMSIDVSLLNYNRTDLLVKLWSSKLTMSGRNHRIVSINPRPPITNPIHIKSLMRGFKYQQDVDKHYTSTSLLKLACDRALSNNVTLRQR